MAAKYIFAALSVTFALFAIRRVVAAGGSWTPETRTWMLIAVIFGAVSGWLFLPD